MAPSKEAALPVRFTDTTGSVLLDLVRGLAAFAVMASHWRNFFLNDYPQVLAQSPARAHGLLWLYALTGEGHVSVVIFFVLSGYLIGGSIFRMLERGEWRWSVYLTHRLVRLWVVLLPGLLLCLFWDKLGLWMHLAPSLYRGGGQNHMTPDVTQRLGLQVFVANLFFVQPMTGPTFGSATALWSLPFEFWYYLMFPLVLIGFRRQTALRTRGVCLLLLAGSCWLCRDHVLPSFPLWLLGAGLAAVPAPRFGRGNAVRWCAAAVYVPIVFSVSRVKSEGLLSDYALALATTLFLWVMLSARSKAKKDGTFARGSRGLSRFSYTLYVTHQPVLLFMTALLVGEGRWDPTAKHLAAAALVMILVTVYAYGVAAVTEFHTDAVRRWVERTLKIEANPKASAHTP